MYNLDVANQITEAACMLYDVSLDTVPDAEVIENKLDQLTTLLANYRGSKEQEMSPHITVHPIDGAST